MLVAELLRSPAETIGAGPHVLHVDIAFVMQAVSRSGAFDGQAAPLVEQMQNAQGLWRGTAARHGLVDPSWIAWQPQGRFQRLPLQQGDSP